MDALKDQCLVCGGRQGGAPGGAREEKARHLKEVSLTVRRRRPCVDCIGACLCKRKKMCTCRQLKLRATGPINHYSQDGGDAQGPGLFQACPCGGPARQVSSQRRQRELRWLRSGVSRRLPVELGKMSFCARPGLPILSLATRPS